jgi:hypothetical protein
MVFIVFLLSSLSNQVQASFDLPVYLDGNTYTAVLSRNNALMTQIQDSNPLSDEADQHYFGKLAEVEDSWVRVSNIAGEWQGVASAFQQMYVIDSTNTSANLLQLNTANSWTLLTRPISSYDHSEVSCGLDKKTQHSSSALVLPKASQFQQRSFNQLCIDKVSDGNGGELCLIAELELAFDQEYQEAVGANAASIATSIINIVDGFYRNDLNISFETLSRTMLTDNNDVFTNSSDADILLNDIKDQKEADGIAFLTNPNALFHFVTGRDFEGSTAGVAFVGVNCAKGFATSTSQLQGSGSDRVALTAVVIAHELGHNFGANHDNQNGVACSSGFIMSPTLDPDADEFSSCSKSDIQSYLGTIEDRGDRAPLNACFNFPVDLGVAANDGNPTAVNKNQTFSSSFALTPKQAIEPIANATFSGNVNGGSIESVSIPGQQSCTVANNKLNFNCNLTNFISNANATIQMQANADQLDLFLNTSVGGTDLRDIVLANNALRIQVTASGGDGSDSTPDAFNFTDQTGVAKNQQVISDPITVNDIDVVTPISVTGGEYSIDNAAFTRDVGVVVNGNSVRVRHTSASIQLTTVDTTLTAGAVPDTFSSTTAIDQPIDNQPDPFRFTDIDSVALATIQTSNSVTILGIDTASAISIVGGQYSVNSQAFTSNAGSVVNGNTVRVQHTASSTAATRTDTTLSIGGISNTFTSTTDASTTNSVLSSSGGGGGSVSLFSLALLVGLKRIVHRKRDGLKQSVCFLTLLLPVTILLACVSRSEEIAQSVVEVKYQQWSEVSQNYEVSFQQLCFCLPDSVRPIRLTVRNNEIVKAIFEDDQSEVTVDVMADLKTIDDIFQTIINAKARPAHSVEIEYDPINHYPLKVDIDFDNRLADDELHWQLSNLVWLNIN